VAGRREEVLGLDLDEAAVGCAFGKQGDFGVGGGRGVGIPAENCGIEGLGACEVGDGDFGPGDHLVGY